MRRVKVTLAIGLLVIAAAIGLTLSRPPLTVARAAHPGGSGAGVEQALAVIGKPTELCQSNEQIPRGVTAIRLWLFSFTGPRVAVKLLEKQKVLTHGERQAGWSGGSVTIPVAKLSTARRVDVCFTIFAEDGEAIQLAGVGTEQAPATLADGTKLPGRMGVELLRDAHGSWWSLASGVAKRMGLGNAGTGLWNAVLVIALMTAVGVLASRLVLRELR